MAALPGDSCDSEPRLSAGEGPPQGDRIRTGTRDDNGTFKGTQSCQLLGNPVR